MRLLNIGAFIGSQELSFIHSVDKNVFNRSIACSDKTIASRKYSWKVLCFFESSNVVVEINVNGTEKSKYLFLQRRQELRARACKGNVQ